MKVTYEIPSVDEFTGLIFEVGWERYTNLQILGQALQNSLCCVVARDGQGKIVGMGRLVGDGVRFVYFQDIIVSKNHQQSGIGTKIMDLLFEWINKHCPSKTYIHLFTDKQTATFYARYGFAGPESSFYGMSQKKLSKKLGRTARRS